MSFPSLSNISPSRDTIYAFTNVTSRYVSAGCIFGSLISILKLTSQNINPWATGLAAGTYILVNNLSLDMLEQHSSISNERVKTFIAANLTAVAATIAFGVYIGVSALSYKVSLATWLVFAVGTSIIAARTKPKNDSEEIDPAVEEAQAKEERNREAIENMKKAANALGAPNNIVAPACHLF